MTLEHRILYLIDRGVSSSSGVESILGLRATIILRSMSKSVSKRGEEMRLTEAGIDRLNELDEGKS
jgi:hypothetical protein